MSIFKYLGVLSPVYMNVFNLLQSREKVGEDNTGNRYYQAKPRKGYKRDRRWVMYAGDVEATNVPPEWHGWLHYQTDVVPAETSFRRPWQKPHQPNMTGTNHAYRPKGHVLEGGQRDKATGDYEAWKPAD